MKTKRKPQTLCSTQQQESSKQQTEESEAEQTYVESVVPTLTPSSSVDSISSIATSKPVTHKVTFDFTKNKTQRFKSTDSPHTLAIHLKNSLSIVQPVDPKTLKTALIRHKKHTWASSEDSSDHSMTFSTSDSSPIASDGWEDEDSLSTKSHSLDDIHSHGSKESDGHVVPSVKPQTDSLKKKKKKANKKRKKSAANQQSTASTVLMESNLETESDGISHVSKKHPKVVGPKENETSDYAKAHEPILNHLKTLGVEAQKDCIRSYVTSKCSRLEDRAKLTGFISRALQASNQNAANDGKSFETEINALLKSVLSNQALNSTTDSNTLPSLKTPSNTDSMAVGDNNNVTLPGLKGVLENLMWRHDSKLDVEMSNSGQYQHAASPDAAHVESGNEAMDLSARQSPKPIVPRFDFYQSDTTATVEFYIRDICEANSKVDLSSQKVDLYLESTAFSLHLSHPVITDKCSLHVTRHKASLTLWKLAPHEKWTDVGSLEEISVLPVDNENVRTRESSATYASFESLPVVKTDATEENVDDTDRMALSSSRSFGSVNESVDGDPRSSVDEMLMSTVPPASPTQSDSVDSVERPRRYSEPPMSPGGLRAVYLKRLDLQLRHPKSWPSSPIIFNGDDVSAGPTTMTAPPRGSNWCGLLNEGVDCFINSIVQCLASIPQFVAYFISGKFKAHINTENALSTSKGLMAFAFAELLHSLANEKQAFVPSGFKAALSKFWVMYDPYTQQDSQEFLNYILDAIHEDVNKIIKKPYIELPDYDSSVPDAQIAAEFWDAHVRRNDSIVIDTFQGQYKSQITCRQCGKTSIKFDAFMNLTMEIPECSFDYNSLLVTKGYSKTQNRFRMLPNVTFGAFFNAMRENDFIGASCATTLVVNREVVRTVRDQEYIRDVVNRRNENATPIYYELEPQKAYVTICHELVGDAIDSTSDGTQSTDDDPQRFGFPLILSVAPGEYNFRDLYETIVEELIAAGALKDITMDLIRESEKTLFDVRITNQSRRNQDETLLLRVDSFVCVALQWSSRSNYEKFYDEEKDMHIQEGRLDEPSPEYLTLDDCIAEHLKEEVIDEWYCSVCKKHTDGLKKLDLWKMPDVLIVHLKRFVQHPRLHIWVKQDSPIKFPINEFDIGHYSINSSEKDKKYELFAVSNHSGGTDHGHYTAFCVRDGEWFEFDDEFVQRVENENQVCTRNGYVLFYRLKGQLQ